MLKLPPPLPLGKSTFLFCLILSVCAFYNARGQSSYNFASSGLQGVVLKNPTSLQFGPDGRLYVSQQDGIIKVFTIVRNSPNNYSVTDTELISIINTIPNHNDNGSFTATVTTRQITGIYVTGTQSNPVIYVSSSDSRIGGPSGDKNLDTNSGIISRLNRVNGVWTKIDLVRGLPRSEENHSVNGMQLDEQNNILYLAIGGSTNAGSPSTNFAYLTEYALSAAILSIDISAVDQMPTLGSGNNAYKYDLPTLDDPTRSNDAAGHDMNDPFGGNDGLNQAKLVMGGPVQVYAPGFRNPYDLVITKTPGKEGRLYSIDNGANQGWGGYPDLEGPDGAATNKYVDGEPGSTGPGVNDPQVNNLDNLHYIGNIYSSQPGSHYGGHPTPVRANPLGAGLYTHSGSSGVWRTSKTGSNPLPSDWPPVPVEMANPIEGDFQQPGVSDVALLTFPTSTNGIAEYTASNFNNALKGVLLAAGYNGHIYKILLTNDGADVTNARSSSNKLNQEISFASGFGSQPLDITAQGDDEIFPGSIWAATYGSHSITVFEPQDMLDCTGVYSLALDEDDDGYKNADEIDNLTDPCLASSKPNDFDQDLVSDRNDQDDDNDGFSDLTDYFSLDPLNGVGTNLPVIFELFNNDPGTGFFGLGFTGLMSNGSSDYLSQFDEGNLIAGGAVGAFSIVEVSEGDALGSLNTQQNAFQFGLNLQASNGPFSVHGRMPGPFFNNMTPQSYQSQGIYVGTGDQDNYLKVVFNSNDGSGGVEVVYENAGSPLHFQYSFSGGPPGSVLDLFLSVDPLAGTIQPKYARDDGPVYNLGSPIVVSGLLLNALQSDGVLAIGIVATSREASPFTATWDYIKVTQDPVTVAGQWQGVGPVSGSVVARHENAYVRAGDMFYLMGGRGIKPVQAFNPVDKTWTNKSNTPIELHHFQAVSSKGLIYVAGAMTGSYPHEDPVPNIHIYNPVTDKWILGPSIPETRRRGSAGVVVYNNKIYLVCGIQDGHWTGHVPWLDVYDPSTNSWQMLADAPRPRDHFHSQIINGKIYVAGGRRTSASTNEVFNLTVSEVDVYDIATNTWTTLPSSANIPTQRAGTSAAVLGDELIIIGGESAQASAHVETEALNVQTNTWRSLDDLQQGRHGSQAIVSNSNIYIVAGSANKGGGPELATQETFFMFAPSTPILTALEESALSAPESKEFGTVDLGSTLTQSISISNAGSTQAIVISSVSIDGSQSFALNSPYSPPFVIPPQESVSMNVNFTPMAGGTHMANLIIGHSGIGGTTDVALNGDGAGPGLTVSPLSLHFFSQEAGATSSPQSFTFANNTEDAIDISSLSLTGTNSSEFQHDASGTISLIPGASATVNITFSPISLGTKVAQLEVVHTGINSPINLGLTGEGHENPEQGEVVYRINSGGLEVTTAAGVFSADNYYTPSPGFKYTKTGEIAATVDDALYQTERSSGVDNGTFNYAFPVEDGEYNIVLHFAEIYWTVVGKRVFDVTAEGVKVLDDYDIMVKVGAPMTATTESFAVTVLDGVLDIHFSAELSVGGVNRPKVSAIEVISVSGGNQVPMAHAGADIQITAPLNSTILDGSGTDLDGSIISYMWSQVSGPNTATLTDATDAKPGVSGLVTGTYEFSLVVTDDMNEASVPDQVLVTVLEEVSDPSEIIYRINSGGWEVTTVSGVFSADNFFIPSPGFKYTKIGEIAGTVDDALYQTERSSEVDNGTFSYAFPVDEGEYGIVLHFAELYWSAVGKRVFDVTAEGIKILDDYDIMMKTGSAMTATTESFTVTVLDGVLDIHFSAELSEGGVNRPKVSAIEVISVSGGNQLPIAHAGEDIQITSPLNSTILDGSGTDLDGSIVSYMWSQVSGPNTATVTDATQAKPAISGLVTGTYEFSLVVTDNMNATSLPDQVSVTVFSEGQQLVSFSLINADTEQVIQTLSNGNVFNLADLPSANLNIQANTHPAIVGSVKFSLSGAQEANVIQDTAPYALFGVTDGDYHSWVPPLGSYTLQAEPYTESGAAGVAGTPLTVSFEVIYYIENSLPTVNAGPDQTISLPANSVALNSEATDSDGTIVTYSWMQQSGPNSASFSSLTEPDPTVSDLIAGVYVFRLTVTDDADATALDDIAVTVNDPSATQQVVSFTLVDANSDVDIRNLVPGETINLATLSSQNLNIRANTSPSLVGSVKFALTGAQTKNQTETAAPYALFGDVSGNYNAWVPPLGDYSLQCTPFTASGGSGTPGTPLLITFTVVNQSSGNLPPNAYAGFDQEIMLPVSSVTLDGSGTDSDGTITDYSWAQLSGPDVAVFSDPNTSDPIVNDLVAGSYVFRLMVMDNDNATAFDDVTVTVTDPSTIQQVVSFTLVNATNEMDIREIVPGETIDLSTLPSQSINIRANTNPVTVGSVKFALSGAQIKNQTETASPYVLFGDVKGNYNVWNPPLGGYTLVGTPYTGSSGSGDEGLSLTVNFTFVNGSASLSSARVASNNSTANSTAVPSIIPVGYEGDVTVFPNPFHKSVSLKIHTDGSAQYGIKLYDHLGRLVLSEIFRPVSADTNVHTLNLPETTSGTHFIVVESETNRFRKIIKVLRK